MGILLALLSAAVWGTADFAGGFATRRANQYQVLGLSALSGMKSYISRKLPAATRTTDFTFSRRIVLSVAGADSRTGNTDTARVMGIC